MRRLILLSCLFVSLACTAGLAMAKPADVSGRAAELRKKVEDIGRLMRTLMVASDYNGEFKAYVGACQDRILTLGSRKYQEGRAKPEGELTAIITILRDGKVHGIRIHKPSGHSELDLLLTQTVYEAAPFAPFPEELAKDYDRLALTLRFRYRTDPESKP